MEKEKPSAQQIAMQMEIGRLSFLTDHNADAATAFKHVMEALEIRTSLGLMRLRIKHCWETVAPPTI